MMFLFVLFEKLSWKWWYIVIDMRTAEMWDNNSIILLTFKRNLNIWPQKKI